MTLSLTMRNLFLLLLMISLFSCSESRPDPRTAREMIPADAEYLLRFRNLNAFKTANKNNSELPQWLPGSQSLSQALSLAGHLYSDNPAYLALSDSNFLLLLEGGNDSLNPASANYTSEALNFGSYTYTEFSIDSLSGYIFRDSLFAAYSNSLPYLRTLIEEKKQEDDPWEALLQASNDERLLSILRKPSSPPINSTSEFPFPQDQLVIDLEVAPEMIKVFGVGRITDSTAQTRPPLSHGTPSLLPASASWVSSFTNPEWPAVPGTETLRDSLLADVYEVAMAGIGERSLLILQSYGSQLSRDFLLQQSESIESYQEEDIRKLKSPELLLPLLTKFDNSASLPYFILRDGSMIFSSDVSTLKEAIAAVTMEQTFEKTAAYQTISNSLADAAHALYIKRTNRSGTGEEVEALQLISDQGSLHAAYLNGLASTNANMGGVRKMMELQLQEDAIIPPQFVRNHYTNQDEIVVQDKNQVLYRFGTSGQLLWEKPLSGLINGKIHEVDLYHNNKWQLAFTAGDAFLILDRNGKVVRPFNMDWDVGGQMNGLSVFDYDRDKDYRFVVSSSQTIAMFNRKGQSVKGFTYTKAGSNVSASPKHIRMENRDYLVFQEADGSLKILNRIGRERVPVSGTYDFASEVYPHRNHFVFTDKDGILYRIDRKGNIQKEALNLDPDHAFLATPARTIILNGNLLRIGDKEVTLDFGVYTEPQYFVIRNTLYIALTDLQSHRTYLFNSQAELLPGFPVYGNSKIDLADMDKDGSLELSVLGTDQNVLVYSLKY